MMHLENLFLQQFGVEFPFNFCLFLLLLFLCDDKHTHTHLSLERKQNNAKVLWSLELCVLLLVSCNDDRQRIQNNRISHVRTINFSGNVAIWHDTNDMQFVYDLGSCFWRVYNKRGDRRRVTSLNDVC